ncbi:MAG: GHKL domain-containing protein [Oscillospiraceae bacterium]|nr:GHKL domain-containing protein [Oscillospiraceae bacterium]
MLDSICYTLSAAAAWWLALSYIRIETPAALFHGLLSAALCGLGSFCLYTAGLTSLIPLVSLAVFLLITMEVQAHRRGNCGDAVLAFLLAEGGYSFMAVAGTAFLQHMGIWGLIPACALPALFFLLTCKLRKLFPPAKWREYYTETVLEPGRIQLRLAHNYLIAAGVCAAMTAGAFAVTPEGILETLLWSVAGLGTYWSAILLLILINAYKRERIAVLVEQQYRGEMQSFLNVIRSQRHDYNFHVQTIAGLIRESKIEECKKYVAALEEDFSRMNAVLPVQDPAISAMIHNFQTLAAREGIQLRTDIETDLVQISTNVYETNKIISNLLQNAIDETMTHQDKSYGIDLTILKRGEYCVIRVSNELGDRVLSTEELGKVYQQGYTTKQGHEGVGLSSIRLLAARYHGTVYTQLEGKIIHFVAKIPIDCTKEPVDKG